MSILTQADVRRIFKEHPKKDTINKMREYSRHVYMHLTGEGMYDHLIRVDGLENPAQIKLRIKLAKSNKALMTRSTRPIDKVYSAKGGSIYYDTSTPNVNRFKELVNEKRDKQWMQNTWQNIALADPNGVVFCEVGANQTEQTTYSIEQIYEYETTSSGRFEYIMFEPVTIKQDDREIQYLRVVDDKTDATYKVDGDNLSYLPSKSYPNYFGFVPAIQNSTRHKIKDTKFKISQIDEIIETADEFLLDSSIQVIYKKLHGFPKYWEVAEDCGVCGGTGYIKELDKDKGEVAKKQCPHCGGSGVRMKKDVTDVTLIRHPRKTRDGDEASEVTNIAPNVAGYVSPDLEAWRMMNEERDRLENQIFETLWGTQNVDSEKSETATGRFIDVQPVNDRLNMFKEDAERVYQFILFCKGKFYFLDSFGGVSVEFGSRYLIETPDAIYKKYDEARKNGAPDTVLNYLLEQFYYSEFSNDNINLSKQLKLMKVEPFVHKTLSSFPIGSKEYLKKIYYNEWLSSVNETTVLTSTVDKLKLMFNEYLQNENLSGVESSQTGEQVDNETLQN